MVCHLSQLCSVALTFILVLIFIPGIACNCIGRNRTLDPCRTSTDCDGELVCIDRSNDRRATCRPKSKVCECQTPAIVRCPSESGCARGEGCANVSSTTSSTPVSFCVSCNAIKNPPPTRTVIPFNDAQCVSSPTPLPSPTKRPGTERRNLDFCSTTDPCAGPLVCLDTTDASEPTPCKPESIGCRCYRRRGSTAACSSSRDCNHPLETCVSSTVTGETFCGSCNLVNTNAFFIEASPSDRMQCNSLSSRPPPNFVPSAGLSFDKCSREFPCDKRYTCMFNDFAAFVTKKCTKKTSFDDCFCGTLDRKAPTFIKICDKTTKCPRGEICAQESNTFSSFCISLTRFEQSKPCEFVPLQKLPTRGNAVNDEWCTDDLDCAKGMYCTHPSSEFGKCYNRKQCRCRPFNLKVCESDSDCLQKEACVIQPGSKQDPYCYSRKRLHVNPYLRPVSAKSTAISLPADGWTFDLCKEDTDCKQESYSRACRHSTELNGSCKGRELCVCRPAESTDGQCQNTKDCGQGELCVQFRETNEKSGRCFSKKLLKIRYYRGVYIERKRNRGSENQSSRMTSSSTSSGLHHVRQLFNTHPFERIN